MGRLVHRLQHRQQARRIAQIVAGGVRPLRPEQIDRQRDARMRLGRQRGHLGDRVGDDLRHRHVLVLEPVDEGRVGAVLQQPSDQIGQQILMAADRGVDPARQVRRHDLVVERLAHAMQALELETVPVAGGLHHIGHGLGVVGGELAVDRVAGGQHALGAGQIGNVGRGLAGEHRIRRQPVDLGQLDLGVPIGALDQPDHDPPSVPRGEIDQPVDHRQGALLIRLDRKAQAVPAGQRRVAVDRLEHVEREVEPVGLLGVHGQADAVPLGGQGQRLQPVGQGGRGLDPPAMFVARPQRRQLDRDPGAGDRAASGRTLAYGVDRLPVAGHVALGVGMGARRLAQHVVAVAVALALGAGGAVERLLDGAAHDELPAHDAHGLDHGLADHRLADPLDQPRQDGARLPDLVGSGPDHPAGQHQRPGRGVDENALAMSQMGVPIGAADLVGDQPVGGLRVGNPQQRLGQAHQRHALLGGQAVFLQERLQPAEAVAGLAHLSDQGGGARLPPLLRLAGQHRQRDQGVDRLGLVGPVDGGDGGAQAVMAGQRVAKERHGARTCRKSLDCEPHCRAKRRPASVANAGGAGRPGDGPEQSHCPNRRSVPPPCRPRRPSCSGENGS